MAKEKTDANCHSTLAYSQYVFEKPLTEVFELKRDKKLHCNHNAVVLSFQQICEMIIIFSQGGLRGRMQLAKRKGRKRV